MSENDDKKCCFFGHRSIKETDNLKSSLQSIVEELIVKKGVKTFYFGSKSSFNDLCLDIVSGLKEKYQDIRRIYVRAEFPHIDDDYKNYLLKFYDDTYYPEHMLNSGRAAYVERNQEMINHSDICVVYYDENYMPRRRRNSRRDLTDYQPNSGTKIAYDYAVKKKREIINVFESIAK